jgi:hypothetical protein
MKRRQLLQTVSLWPLLRGGFSALFARAELVKAASSRTAQRVRPSDPSWPEATKWAELKAAVGGRLIAVRAKAALPVHPTREFSSDVEVKTCL